MLVRMGGKRGEGDGAKWATDVPGRPLCRQTSVTVDVGPPADVWDRGGASLARAALPRSVQPHKALPAPGGRTRPHRCPSGALI